MNIADLFFSVQTEGVEKSSSQISSLADSLVSIGGSLIENLSKPLVDVGMSIVETTMTFDKQMSRVSAVTGATGKDFTTLRDLAIDMGSSTSKTATEAAEAIEYMGLAGWDLKEIQAGLEPILRASEAGMMDLGRTSDLVTDSMAALGIGTKDMGRYLDIAAKAQNSSNQSMEQFLEAMVTAGGSFKMFNVPLEEAGALLGILANRGYKGSEAGNALISIMANLTKKGGEAGKAMKELGIKVYDSHGKFRGMTTILTDLNKKFAGMTEEQKNTYIQMIGGKTRTKELNAMLNGTKEELGGLTKKLYDSKGALSNMAKTMQDNFAGQITQLKSKLEGIAIAIGDRLTPYLRIATQWVQKLADWFYELPTSVKDAIIIFGILAASIGPIAVILGTLIAVVAGIVGGISSLVSLIMTIGLPVFAALAGAVTLLVAGFTIFAGVFSAVSLAIGGIIIKTGLLQAAFNSIKAIVGAIVAVFRGDLSQAFTLLTEKFGMSKEQAKFFIEKIKGARDALVKIGTVIKNVTSLLGAIFTADKQKMIDLLRSKFGFTKTEAKKFADKVQELKEKIMRVGEKMKEVAAGAIAKFADMVKKAAKYVYDHRKEIAKFIEKVIDMGLKVGSVAKTLYNKFREIKKFITDSMNAGKNAIKGVVNAFNSAKNAVGGLISKLSGLKFPKMPSWLSNIPGFATGVKNFAGGWAVVGEEGPELLNLPRGSDVYPTEKTKNMLSSGKSQNVSNTTQNVYNVNMSINARDIREVNDMIELINGLKAEPTY